jgi:metal-dependent HD superfamily phosphatase/phosphodiesterase
MDGKGKENREEYVSLLSVLKDVCEKGHRRAHNFVGVYLSNKKNKFMVEPEKRPAQRLSVKLTH